MLRAFCFAEMKTVFGERISFPCVEACCFFDSFRLLTMLIFGFF